MKLTIQVPEARNVKAQDEVLGMDGRDPESRTGIGCIAFPRTLSWVKNPTIGVLEGRQADVKDELHMLAEAGVVPPPALGI